MIANQTPHSTPAPPKPRTWTWYVVRAVLIFTIIPYVAITVFMTVAQRSLIYRPTKTKRLPANALVLSGLQADDVEIHVDDSLTLHGWRFHGRSPADFEPRFLVIYFPGNGGCRAHRVTDCCDFAELGCDVVLFDYRGYGDNQGSPSESALADDARRIWTFATEELQFPPERIVVFGESLGGAMATRLAAELSQAGSPPAALVLNSTFASLTETVAWHYPALPVRQLLWDRYPSVERIAHVTCPILQYHGTADDVVAFEHGQHLFATAPSRSMQGIENQFVTIPGGQHNYITMSDMRATFSPLLHRICAEANDRGQRQLEP